MSTVYHMDAFRSVSLASHSGTRTYRTMAGCGFRLQWRCSGYGHGLMHIVVLLGVWILGASSQDPDAFSRSQVHYTKIDELPGNVVVGNVIRDANLDRRYHADVLDGFILEIIGGQYMDYFIMDTQSVGNLKTRKYVDRDLLCQNAEDCDITLDVAIVQPSDYFQVIQVTLTLLDINDNTPEFIKPHVTVQISENAVPPVSFVLPTATDPDSPTYSIQKYSFTRRSSKFDLELIQNSDDSQDLRLKLLDHLDREVQSSYSLQVQAEDGGVPAKVGLLDIQVIVVDANDNKPVFQRSIYNVSVREDHPLDSPFLKVKATDPDEGPNGQIVYSLSDQALDTFTIDNRSGELSLVKLLDYETQKSYHLLVTATDQGPDSVPVHVRVVINVEDVNDFVPKISVNAWTESGQIEVNENEVRAFVAHVSVVDQDMGVSGQVTCSVTDSRFTLIQMYTNRYKMITTTMLDRERQDLIHVDVRCQDRGKPALSDSFQIAIHVLDQNDNPPVFSKSMYTVSIAETSHIGQSVLTVTATDDDTGSNARITYHLHANSANLLTIDSNSGLITTNSLLDHETTSNLDFYILAIDAGSPAFTGTTTVSMTITDVNDEKPIFAQPSYNFGTFENQLPGTEIGTVQAKDRDAAPNDVFVFSLSDNSTFSIHPTTGLITTNKVLDREHEAAYYLYVQATDLQPPYLSSTVSLTIYVADRNDNAPRILFPTDDNNTVEISSFSSPGYVITHIMASDADLGNNARLQYMFGKGNLDGMFTLDPLSGILTLQGDLAASKQDQYQLLIIVKDHGLSEGQKSAMATLNILINRTVDFAHASNVTPQLKRPTSIALGYHEKILIIIGAVTLVIVSLLIVAIICIKRRQVNQERDSYKYMCRVDMANMRKELNKQNMSHQDKLNVLDNNVEFTKTLNSNAEVSSNSTLDDNSRSIRDILNQIPPKVAGYAVSMSAKSSLSQPNLSLNTSSACPVHNRKESLTTFRATPATKTIDRRDSDSTSGCSADVSNTDSFNPSTEQSSHGAHSYHGSNAKVKDARHTATLPHLPTRGASLGKVKNHQIGCHGYRNGGQNLKPNNGSTSRNLSRYNALTRPSALRNGNVSDICEEADDLISAYSPNPQYNSEHLSDNQPKGDAVSI